jgi:hypothetical protein
MHMAIKLWIYLSARSSQNESPLSAIALLDINCVLEISDVAVPRQVTRN